MEPTKNRTDEFLGLFLKAEPRVYAYIRSQVAHRADADDVLQETAATLWAKFDEYAAGTNFPAWAYQVARFKVQHFRDKQTRRRRLFSQAFVDAVAVQSEELAGRLGELQSLLADCMRKLPQADREVVERCYDTDATVAAAAAVLGRPVNTVKSVLKRARRALFDCIQRGIGGEGRQ